MFLSDRLDIAVSELETAQACLRRLRRVSEQRHLPEEAFIAWALHHAQRISRSLASLQPHIPRGGTPCALFDPDTGKCAHVSDEHWPRRRPTAGADSSPARGSRDFVYPYKDVESWLSGHGITLHDGRDSR
jgi:hypothetical protein